MWIRDKIGLGSRGYAGSHTSSKYQPYVFRCNFILISFLKHLFECTLHTWPSSRNVYCPSYARSDHGDSLVLLFTRRGRDHR